MGWVNFVIIKDLKLVVEAPRSVRPDEGLQQYVEKVLDGEVADVSEDEFISLDELEDKPCTQITVLELSKLIKVYNDFRTLQEVSYAEHLLYWLKKSGIAYEMISESALLSTEKKEELLKEIGDFLTVCSGEEEGMKVMPFSQYLRDV